MTAQPPSATKVYAASVRSRRRNVTQIVAVAASSTAPIHSALDAVGAVRRKSPMGQIPASWKPLSGCIRLPSLTAADWPLEKGDEKVAPPALESVSPMTIQRGSAKAAVAAVSTP